MPMLPLVEPGQPLTREQVERYSRHLLLGPLGAVGQRRLLAARVLVVGAGGLGAPVLQYLAAAGVGHLGIVDDDVVDASNLQRQVIHTLADVGRPKVDSAAEKIAALNPDVRVERHLVRLDAANARDLVAGYDLVLDGTDNFPTRYLVSDVCAELGVPVVWGSILRFDAQISVFWSRPNDGRPGVTLRDVFPTPPPAGTTPSCGEAGVLGAMCGQVGSLMAAEAVKLVTGAGDPLLGRVLVLDVLGARSSELPVRPRPGAAPPTTVAELGYDPAGSPAGTVGAALCALPAAALPEPAEVPAISVRSLADRLDARERGTDAFVLLDVREPAERDIVTIPGAVNVPLAEVLADTPAVLARLGAGGSATGPAGTLEVLVHCRSGVRSARAVRALAAAGARATNVGGGVLAWAAEIDRTAAVY